MARSATSPSALETQVAIIGAGPAGTATAVRLGQLGVRDVVLVDRLDFPRDKTCGSGVSPKGIGVLRRLGVWEAIAPHAYPIFGLRLVTPGDREVVLSGGRRVDAVVCLRRVLDQALLDRATSLGVRFVPNFTVTALASEGDRTTGFTGRDGRRVRARYTVVADGAHSSFVVARDARRPMQAIMGWWDGVPFTPHHVEMVFDRMVTPGYGWLFPESPTRVNIGICYEDPAHRLNARQLFGRFLDKHYRARLGAATPVGRFKGHPIAYCYRVGRLASAGRLVVGEAGRMTQPATAEGIYQGMRSGVLAAEALAAILSGREREAAALAAYENRCRRAFRLSFGGAAVWRAAIRSSLPDWIVTTAQRPAVRRAIGRLMATM